MVYRRSDCIVKKQQKLVFSNATALYMSDGSWDGQISF